MHDHHDKHSHRDPDVIEEPFDAANESLSDALRASFGILKLIMVVLVCLYLISNIESLESHEQALVLRFGRLLPVVQEAGLVKAFPFPIDEIVKLPTRQRNELVVDSHTFHRFEDEIGKKLSFLVRSPRSGLNPSLDGALLTADSGLVHLQWKVTYEIGDVRSYVQGFLGKKVEAAQKLIQLMVESIGIQVASEMTAEEMIRTRVDDVQRMMKERLNRRLTALDSGVNVVFIEMFEPTPPLQIRKAFDGTQAAENTKERRIRQAEQEASGILSGAAGAAHTRLVAVLDDIEAGGGEGKSVEQLRAELDNLLENEVEGQAGKTIKDAGAYLSVVVGRMQSDVEMYRTHLPDYKRNPTLLIERLWEQTRQAIFRHPGVVKIYRPPGVEFRLHVPLDPEQTRIEEEMRLQKKEFDPSSLRTEHLHPIGPGEGYE